MLISPDIRPLPFLNRDFYIAAKQNNFIKMNAFDGRADPFDPPVAVDVPFALPVG
jgi:hypothetical protein